MKTLDILEFVKEQKTRRQLDERFGKPIGSLLASLLERGSIRKFTIANPDSESKYAKFTTVAYVATGKPYVTQKINNPSKDRAKARVEYARKHRADMRRLRESAPDLLYACQMAVVALAAMLEQCPPIRKEYEIVSNAIAKATGAV